MSEKMKKELPFTLDIGLLMKAALKILKRYWWFYGLLVAVLSLTVMLVWKKTYTPTYKSYCSFTVKVINDSTTGEINTLYGFYYDKDLADQLDKTITYILTSDLLNDNLREELGRNVQAGNIEVTCVKGSNLFTLTTYGASPEESAKLLDAVYSVYADAARYVVGELQVELVETPVIGKNPTNAPDVKKAGFIGLVISAMVGFVCSLLQVKNVQTVSTPDQLEGQVNMPCLGVLPENENKEAGKGHSRGEFREGIRGLARKLEQDMEAGNKKVLLVTGTVPGEGKTTLCRHLAYTLADWGKRVYLIDADLRKPSLYRQYGIQGRSMPLQKVLLGQESLECVCYKPHKNLTAICNTVPVIEPTVLLDSPDMEKFLQELTQNADYVIIDAPPCDTMSDVTVLQRYADGVLYVVRQDYAQIPKIIQAVEGLYQSGDNLMGYVLSCAKRTAQGYGKYGYGAYSYGKYGNGYYGKYGHYGKSGYSKYYMEEDGSPSDR